MMKTSFLAKVSFLKEKGKKNSLMEKTDILVSEKIDDIFKMS